MVFWGGGYICCASFDAGMNRRLAFLGGIPRCLLCFEVNSCIRYFLSHSMVDMLVFQLKFVNLRPENLFFTCALEECLCLATCYLGKIYTPQFRPLSELGSLFAN